MKPAGTRVVFMGSPAFAVPSLRALAAAGYEVVAVVTQPDRPAGRGGRLTPPEVKVAALELGIPVLQPETLKDEAVRAQLRALEPHLFVVAAFGKILSTAVLGIPSRGCVNVHASLLPRWRGASPIAAAIRAGDSEAGVSIMEMVREMDAGPVIARAAIPVAPDDTTGTLEARLAELGAAELVRVLPPWFEGHITAEPQDPAQVTFCGLIRKEDGQLRDEMTAAAAERAIRACDPWPGAFVGYRDQRLGIWRAHVEPLPGEFETGAFTIAARRPAIAFPDGLLVLDEVQRTGAKRLPGDAFLNGERGQLPLTAGLA
ncbi:MAG: methionyl-tRNA formyltransferase [Dehalococcoidia bacterium]|nr:methionyl-tRNA formyltransferase [Dehalococcoidia bacterium]